VNTNVYRIFIAHSSVDKNPEKTRKEQNTIKKIQEIRDTIQGSVLYAKLKKSFD